jgi:hypothetical protein
MSRHRVHDAIMGSSTFRLSDPMLAWLEQMATHGPDGVDISQSEIMRGMIRAFDLTAFSLDDANIQAAWAYLKYKGWTGDPDD